MRPNLSFIVRETDNKEEKLIEILRNVPGTGVVYIRNRKKQKILQISCSEKDQCKFLSRWS